MKISAETFPSRRNLSKAIKDEVFIIRDEVEEVAKGVSRIQLSQTSSSSQDLKSHSLFIFEELHLDKVR